MGKADDQGEADTDARDRYAEPEGSAEWPVSTTGSRTTRRKVNWVLDVDIESFFDRIDHEWLMKFLEVRIGDPRVLRLIEKWLRAGVSEDGEWSETRVGTPQGAVISTFDFLGFTHICAKTRTHGWFTVRRHTVKKRLRAKIRQVREMLMRRRDEPVEEHGRRLRSVVQGHLNYYAVPGNYAALDTFLTEVRKGWLRVLRRRSQKGRNFTWKKLSPLAERWLPAARILHPYPTQRLSVNHPR